ncbi:transporter [Ganoderma sinense ZZ0214-1]|uniref:Transporter n=1 Tax=Ganoderma sinense ZZ0214-1 TaxID=1077348 RepID=A0A2G8RMP4_9APHY|nr:transporter [Ganoderma sinense ZZ0214-1]
MVLVVFSTLLYFAERGTWDQTLGVFLNSDGDPSQFASIPAAGWFVIVTITTVGYGEITPRSFLGRVITLPLLVFGLLLIALPTFVLGREFSIVWEFMEEAQVSLPLSSSAEQPLTLKPEQKTREQDEQIDPFHDPLASPLLAARRPPEIATTTSLWRHAPEEISRPRATRVASISSNAPGPLDSTAAHNETSAELRAHLSELRAKVDRQEEMLRRIMAAVEGRQAQHRDAAGQEGSRSR